ncbi:MAG: HD domain-containing protein [Anaerolineales bacterium]
MEHGELMAHLDRLLRETYSLWDPGWVSFNWRNYTYDHVQRVRGLAVTLATREGGDPLVAELAAQLHDITKPYDGEYLTGPDGQRLVDEHGRWRNALRPPARANVVTRLYDELGLAGTLHSESGAAVARQLLACYGVAEAVIEQVAQTILDHLGPDAAAPIESRCLYDADTIDANIGLPALVRNIYIQLHFYDARRSPGEPPIAETLASDPLRFLRPYIGENLPRWAGGKRQDFIPRLTTAAGRELAGARLDRLQGAIAWLAASLDDNAARADHSGTDLILHYMRHADDPSLWAETQWLIQTWTAPHTPPQTMALLTQLRDEMRGVI